MKSIDYVECKLLLTHDEIDFEELVDEYIKDEIIVDSKAPENDDLNNSRYREEIFIKLNNRFVNGYLWNILSISDGYSKLHVKKENDVKKYLHRFLVYHCENGGQGVKSNGAADLFEKISANAVQSFLGGESKQIIVGEGRDMLKEDLLKDIAASLLEKVGCFNNLPSRAQDDGVDFIVYKDFDLRGVGNIIILGQACIGKHYKTKKPIHKRWKCEYINFAVTPLCLLSIVHYLDKEKLHEIHSEFSDSIVFDRLRIMKYYNIEDAELNLKIRTFVENNINLG